MREKKRLLQLSTSSVTATAPSRNESVDDTSGIRELDSLAQSNGDHSRFGENDRNGLPLQYDRVLVDAECVHDGSYRHLSYIINDDVIPLSSSVSDVTLKEGIKSLKPHASSSYHDSLRVENITNLQQNLIRNGFRQLKVGGVLVYSTCSLSHSQNEAVVEWLLVQEVCAGMLDFDDSLFRNTEDRDLAVGLGLGSDLGLVSESGSESKVDSRLNCAKNDTSNMAVAGCRAGPLEILAMSDSHLLSYIESYGGLDNEYFIKTLSDDICKAIKDLQSPPFKRGNIPGTIVCRRECGTSGLFLARITKRQPAYHR